jgi:tRNA A37 threonylcarbamoyladenosine dehydratase
MATTGMETISSTRTRRFGGIARLYGEQALGRLAAAHICVIGIGGVGSWTAEALARSGVGRLTLIDLDHVAESNLNRQIHALESTLGQAKVLAMKDRVAAIDPACAVTTIEEFVTPDNVADILPGCDAVVDAIDQVRAKAALIVHCRRLGIPLVTTGGAGGKSDPALIRVDDLARTTQDPLAAKLRAALRRDHGFTRDPRRKFGVDCVYSLEPVRRPEAAACDVDEPAPHGLNCAGYGSSVCVTAGFGFAAASRVLARYAQLVEAR